MKLGLDTYKITAVRGATIRRCTISDAAVCIEMVERLRREGWMIRVSKIVPVAKARATLVGMAVAQ